MYYTEPVLAWCDRLESVLKNNKDTKTSRSRSSKSKLFSKPSKSSISNFDFLKQSSGSNQICPLQEASSSTLEPLSRGLRESRRYDRKQSELKSAGKEALEISYQHLAQNTQQVPSNLLALWAHYRKESTINQYGSYFRHWVSYSSGEHKPPLPVCSFTFSAWLAAAALKDKTASPTEMRCASISFFSKIASAPDPMENPVVMMTKESIKRKLGFKNTPKMPLQKEQVDRVVTYLVSRNTLQDLANAFRISLGYEATLRWDD